MAEPTVLPSVRPSVLPTSGSDDVLWLVDLSNYVFRAYHALPPLTNSHGEQTNATLGTLNMLNRMIEDYRCAYLAVVMDSKDRGKRLAIYPEYKQNRTAAPPELVNQIERCKQIFEAYGVPIYHRDGYEADDLIATLTRLAIARGLRVVIASTDKDLMQLVVPGKVLCWDAMRNSVYGVPEVHKKFGVGPDKLLDVLAFMGDSSDNVPGVPGVGPKTAAQLIESYGSVDGVYQHIAEVKKPKLHQSLVEHEGAARLSLELVRLRDDADLPLDLDELRYGTRRNNARLRELFTELQFTRFLEMVEEDDSPVPDSDPTPTYRTLFERSQLETLAAEARAAGRLAIVALGLDDEQPMRTMLVGVALSPAPGNAAYLPLAHRYLTAPAQLSLDDAREVLRPLLADPAIAKVGHDLKFTQVLLARHGMPVVGARDDSMIASYLLNPETTHKMGLIAEKDANMRWTDFEKLVPKGKKGSAKPTLEEVEVELATHYGCAHAEAAIRLADRYRPRLERHGLDKLMYELEMPLSEILVGMEQLGVLVDPAPLGGLAESMSQDMARLEQEAHAAAGHEFNLASPKQLEQVLFDELGLAVLKKTRTGRSTDHEALEHIEHDHALPRLVLEHRGVAKLKGTYCDSLPTLIHPDTGRIHTRWEQAVAATGRLSSKDPNLQNIPIRSAHGKRIREAFIAPPGMVVLSADYSQIELRVLAHLSHDAKLVEAFTTGMDVHVRTAMEVFDVPEAEVTDTMRAQSKTVNFGVIYGMGPQALAKRLGISRQEAKGFIDAYFVKYSGVRSFMEDTLKQAHKDKTVRTLLGRRRILPDLTSTNHARRSYAERIAQNTPIQGTAADLLKLAMVRLAEPIVPGARMVLTVHDELVFEVPEDRAEEAAAKTRAAMESIIALDVPLVVDVGFGKNWAQAH
jgi:DNA polymerase-1